MGQDFVFPAMRLASLLQSVVQGLAGEKSKIVAVKDPKRNIRERTMCFLTDAKQSKSKSKLGH